MSDEIEKVFGLDKLPPPPDRAARTLTDGSAVPPDHADLKPNGQQKGYVVLSAEERAKGFVRPVRHSYKHVGRPAPGELRDLTPEEQEMFGDEFVKFEPYAPGSRAKGRYWSQDELDRLGGCGGVTTMGDALAETYARDPGFYSGTFCCHCGKHYPVGDRGEFLWIDGSDERVGT